MNPQASKGFAYSLALLPWDVFASLTFKNPLPSERVRWKLAWGHLNAAARSLRVPYPKLLIALRSEHGELGDRPHFHYLLGGTGAKSNLGLAFWLGAEWRKLTGSHAEIRPYDRRLAGADYVEKCLDIDGGNFYELAKFNRADRLELSASVFKRIELSLRQCERSSASQDRTQTPGYGSPGAKRLLEGSSLRVEGAACQESRFVREDRPASSGLLDGYLGSFQAKAIASPVVN